MITISNFKTSTKNIPGKYQADVPTIIKAIDMKLHVKDATFKSIIDNFINMVNLEIAPKPKPQTTRKPTAKQPQTTRKESKNISYGPEVIAKLKEFKAAAAADLKDYDFDATKHKFKVGDKYRSDFDYKGMLEAGANLKMVEDINYLTNLHSSFEDVNYSSSSKPLWEAIKLIKNSSSTAPKTFEDKHGISAKQAVELFNKNIHPERLDDDFEFDLMIVNHNENLKLRAGKLYIDKENRITHGKLTLVKPPIKNIKGVESLKNITGKETLRPPMSGVFADVDKYAATDAHKLVVLDITPPKADQGKIINVNPKISGHNEKYIDGTYPNYESILPKSYDQKTNWINIDDLLLVANTASKAFKVLSSPTTGIELAPGYIFKENILLSVLICLKQNGVKKIKLSGQTGRALLVETDQGHTALCMPFMPGMGIYYEYHILEGLLNDPSKTGLRGNAQKTLFEGLTGTTPLEITKEIIKLKTQRNRSKSKTKKAALQTKIDALESKLKKDKGGNTIGLNAKKKITKGLKSPVLALQPEPQITLKPEAAPTAQNDNDRGDQLDAPAVKVKTKNNLMEMEFETLYLDQGWQNFMQNPAANMKIAIWGKPKNGKTSGALQLANYLTKHGPVLYNFADQGFNKSTQELWLNSGLADKQNATPSDINNLNELEKEIGTGKYKFVFIDMINDYINRNGITPQEFKDRFIKKHPNTSFVLVFETTKAGDFKGNQAWTHVVDAIVTVENFLMENRGRYGAGHFIVWEEGLKKFDLKKYEEIKQQEEEAQPQTETSEPEEEIPGFCITEV